MPELPLSVEERLAALEAVVNKLKGPPMDLLLQEGYLQIGNSTTPGSVRLDGKSVQIASGDTSTDYGAIAFVPSMQVEPLGDNLTSNPPKAYITGRANTSGFTRIRMGALDTDPPSADMALATVTVETPGSSHRGTVTLAVILDATPTEYSTATLRHIAGTDAGVFELLGAFLQFDASVNPIDATPSNAVSGAIWYDSTDNQFKFYEGSTIKTLGGGGMPTPITMSPQSLLSVGQDIAANATTAAASGTYPSANRAILIPFDITEDITITQLWAYNGATASGNIDVGIYDDAFGRVVSSGTTAQAGTNVLQVFNITDTPLTAGQYYFAVAMDNTTGTLFRQTVSAENMRTMGCFQMASAFVLPSTVTPAAVASAFMPRIGWTRKAVI